MLKQLLINTLTACLFIYSSASAKSERTVHTFNSLSTIDSVDAFFVTMPKGLVVFNSITIPPEQITYTVLGQEIATLFSQQSYFANNMPDLIYAIGKISFSEAFTGYIVGIPHEYGWVNVYIRIFDRTQQKFTDDFYPLALLEGDAGEEMRMRGWINDINQDGIPEIITRHGMTSLDIDAPESERETSVDDSKLFVFNPDQGQYKEQPAKSASEQEQLNKAYLMELSEF